MAYESLPAAVSTAAAYFELLDVVASWVAEHGIEKAQARGYIAALFANLSPDLRAPAVDFGLLAVEHSTRGSLNDQFAHHVASSGAADVVRSGLDALLDRLGEGLPQRW